MKKDLLEWEDLIKKHRREIRRNLKYALEEAIWSNDYVSFVVISKSGRVYTTQRTSTAKSLSTLAGHTMTLAVLDYRHYNFTKKALEMERQENFSKEWLKKKNKQYIVNEFYCTHNAKTDSLAKYIYLTDRELYFEMAFDLKAILVTNFMVEYSEDIVENEMQKILKMGH